jgi:Putative lipoprotein LpqV
MSPITANSLAHMSAVRCCRDRMTGLLTGAALAVVLIGCSSSHQVTPSSSVSSTVAAAEAAPGPVQVGISPGGVTTSLSAPASSTEEEFYQACHWARLWMADQPGDPHAQVEPYLAMVQASPTGENGSWHTPWSQLTPERQAGLIVAVTSAADGLCD